MPLDAIAWCRHEATREALRSCSARRWPATASENVRALAARIERYVRDWDEHATPLIWVKTADEILAKAVRKSKDHSRTDH